MTTKTTILAGMLIALITGGTLAYANPGAKHENDAIAELAKARISLSEAITTAERHASGKAVHATLEDKNGRPVYDIEVASADKVMDVRVDGADGKIISAKQDKADVEHEDHEEDEE